MDAVTYWLDEAAKFKEVAKSADDRADQAELLALARACEAVANSVAHRDAAER